MMKCMDRAKSACTAASMLPVLDRTMLSKSRSEDQWPATGDGRQMATVASAAVLVRRGTTQPHVRRKHELELALDYARAALVILRLGILNV